MSKPILSFSERMHCKCVEPDPRLRGGVFGYAVHRFPIKGGISLWEVVVRQIAQSNEILRQLNESHK